MIKKDNLILIDKPKGITSFDVIRVLRKMYNKRKMGHSGTLDPLATGLLIIGIEKGTKELKKLIGLNKIYQATILLGKKTTTGDLEGKILTTKKVNKVNIQKIKEILKKITGTIKLPVPVFSAIKKNGKPLYKIAREKGYDAVKPPLKEMTIFWIKLKNHQPDGDYYNIEIELKVSSGTYIRSIAEEIGRQLNLPATIKKLRRTQIGKFKVENAIKID
jgi:tRNA pseudouridine55 synthase